MSWLDTVLATPVIGLQLKPSFRTSLVYQSLLAEFLDSLLEKKHPVNIAQLQPAGLQVALTDSGHALKFDITNVVAEFRYQYQGELSPGELPSLKDVTLRPYSEVAGELIDLVAAAADALAEKGSPLVCNRFGLVVRASLAEKSVPPGVAALKAKLAGHWNRQVPKMDSTVLVRFADGDSWVEQCHHKVTFDETTQPGQLGLALDWQRVFTEPVELQKRKANGFLAECFDAGLKYFERVADGGFEDE
ncbi:MAG: hypothetical protein ABIK09_06950 [Pseudomonadota bacterium]